MDDKELVKQYEPILCFDRDEMFLPESITRMVLKTDLYRKQSRRGFGSRKIFEERVAYLASLQDTEEWSLVLPELDLNALASTIGGVTRYGVTALREVAKFLYGNNPLHPNSSDFSPMYYARVVDNIRVAYPDNRPHDSEKANRYAGTYTIIQYYPFYIYNDSANQHQGDWDSTIEVCINKERPGDVFVFYYQHHTWWLTKMLPVNHPLSLKEWIMDWDNKQKDEEWTHRDIGSCYAIGTHPLGFVAKGAHGIYPTPGITQYAINIPISKADIPFTTDERRWGLSIGPAECDGKILETVAGIKPISLVGIYHWDEPELLVNQDWLKFKGKFGQSVPKREGWSGPHGPKQQKVWKEVHQLGQRFSADYGRYRKRYNRAEVRVFLSSLSKILLNKHVLM